MEAADRLERCATEAQDHMIRDHPQLMVQVRPEDGGDRMTMFDLMVSIQSGRFTGRQRHGGPLPAYEEDGPVGPTWADLKARLDKVEAPTPEMISSKPVLKECWL